MAGTRKYSEEQIETGLSVLALTGSSRHAARELAKNGLKIPRQVLDDWSKVQHPERFQAIRKAKIAEIRERAAQRSEDIARAAAEKEMEFIAALHPEELEGRDRSNALRNLSTTRGISTDVARKLRDEPDTIIEHRHSGTEMIEQLARTKPHLVVDIEDAEVVEDDEPKQLKAA